jgi:hypothetical protein
VMMEASEGLGHGEFFRGAVCRPSEALGEWDLLMDSRFLYQGLAPLAMDCRPSRGTRQARFEAGIDRPDLPGVGTPGYGLSPLRGFRIASQSRRTDHERTGSFRRHHPVRLLRRAHAAVAV